MSSSFGFTYRFNFELLSPGLRPPYGEVVEHVYGADANVDTEGNSHPYDSLEWTELAMRLRPPPEVILRKYPVVEMWMNSNVMCVGSDDEDLALKAATFLAERTGAALRMCPTKDEA